MPADALIGRALLSVDLRKGNLAGQFASQMAAVQEAGRAESGFLGNVLGATFTAAKVGVLAVGGAALAAAGYGLMLAKSFDFAMEQIHTQAGASQAEVDRLRRRVLELAPTVGMAPEELARALYHVESAGFSGEKALEMAIGAAKLAKMGLADIDHTAQAVVGTMAAFGDQGMTAARATAYLNAIVGTGDMRMEGLASAMATGILPAARNFGLSMADVGAALATLTDNVTPPEEAATRLRMTFALLGAPTQAAAKALESVGIGAEEAGRSVAKRDRELATYGITVNQLAADLHKPNGLLVAIGDLKTHMSKAGLNAQEQAAVLSRAFGGGRSSAAILTLISQYDRFTSKYGQQANMVGSFDEKWAATTQQLNFQLDAAKSKIDAAAIAVGERLMPYVMKLLPPVADLAVKGFALLGVIIDKAPGWFEQAKVGMNHAREAAQNLRDNIVKLWDKVKGAAIVIGAVLTPSVVGWALVAGTRAVVAAMEWTVALVANTVAQLNNARGAFMMGYAVTGYVLKVTVGRAAVALWTGVVKAARFAQDLNTFALQRGYLGTIRYVGGLVASRVAALASAVATGVWTAATTLATAIQTAYATGGLRAVAMMGVARLATIAWTVVQWLLNVALTANPIGLVIAAIALLAAGVIWAYNNVGWFHDAVNLVWEKLKQFGGWVHDNLLPLLQKLGDGVKATGDALNAINPFAKHSPSLVEQVDAGTRLIANRYRSMADAIAGHAGRAGDALNDMTGAGAGGGSGVRQGGAGLGGQVFNFYGDVKPDQGVRLGKDIAWELKASPA